MNFKLRAADSAERILPITEAMSEHGRRAKIERQHAGIATMQVFSICQFAAAAAGSKSRSPKMEKPQFRINPAQLLEPQGFSSFFTQTSARLDQRIGKVPPNNFKRCKCERGQKGKNQGSKNEN
jgi:hypothetical protein